MKIVTSKDVNGMRKLLKRGNAGADEKDLDPEELRSMRSKNLVRVDGRTGKLKPVGGLKNNQKLVDRFNSGVLKRLTHGKMESTSEKLTLLLEVVEEACKRGRKKPRGRGIQDGKGPHGSQRGRGYVGEASSTDDFPWDEMVAWGERHRKFQKKWGPSKPDDPDPMTVVKTAAERAGLDFDGHDRHQRLWVRRRKGYEGNRKVAETLVKRLTPMLRSIGYKGPTDYDRKSARGDLSLYYYSWVFEPPKTATRAPWITVRAHEKAASLSASDRPPMPQM